MVHDETDILDTNVDDEVREAAYMLVAAMMNAESLVTPMHLLKKAVKEKGDLLMYAEDEPTPDLFYTGIDDLSAYKRDREMGS